MILTKPLCFFDLETTGRDIATARIVSISVIKINPDGSTEGKSTMVNPLVPIAKEAMEVHGITEEMVRDKPTFRQISKAIYAFLKDCDLGGYNCITFDIPILSEEFLRCDIEFPLAGTSIVDAYNIFMKKESRDLKSALQFYCNRTLEDAHSSDADTLACKDVFFSQVERYEDLNGKTIEELAAFSKRDNRVDYAGKIVRDEDGDYVYNMGAKKGMKMKLDMSFGEWMLDKDFISLNTKMVVRKAIDEIKNSIETKF